jgi:3-deoxy-D-manno-octulosonate 8-phosphate phosphatase (KDO 8-P phosphatase)
MTNSLNNLLQQFKGSFITEPKDLQQKLLQVKAYIFDWDGVFNNGKKEDNGSSSFNEIDAMGTNLLRFHHYLRTGTIPQFIIISGENNHAARTLALREHYQAVYTGVKFKTQALEHLCEHANLQPEEVAFVFDDVLDFSVAKVAGVRMMVGRNANPLLTGFAVQENLVDYITHHDGNHHAVREAIELMMGLTGNYDRTISERMNYTETYQQYLQQRNEPEPKFFTSQHSTITELSL